MSVGLVQTRFHGIAGQKHGKWGHLAENEDVFTLKMSLKSVVQADTTNTWTSKQRNDCQNTDFMSVHCLPVILVLIHKTDA